MRGLFGADFHRRHLLAQGGCRRAMFFELLLV